MLFELFLSGCSGWLSVPGECDSAADTDTGRHTDSDSDTDSDTDTDTDTDTDPTPCADEAGRASIWYFGNFETFAADTGIALDAATVGLHAACPGDPEVEATLCTLLSTVTEGTLDKPDLRCPDCIWSFEITLVDNVATGPSCAEIGYAGGPVDETVQRWGFGYEYALDDRVIENVVWYYSTRGWVPFAYTDASYVYVTVDYPSTSFFRYAGSSSY